MSEKRPDASPFLSIRWAPLALILLLSAGLRLYGNHWGLPNAERFTTLYVDEYTPFHWLSRMDPRHLDFNPKDFRVPTFFYYQIGVALKGASSLGLLRIINDQAFYLKHTDEYAKLYYLGRALTALYGVVLTALLFFLGKRITASVRGGLLSAAFYAVVPLAVVSCHVIDVGVPVAFWLGFSFFSLLKAVEDSHPRWLWIGAFTAGLSLSTKYTSAPVILLVGYALYQMRWTWTRCLAASATVLAGFLVGTPYAALDHVRFMSGFNTILNAYVIPNSYTLYQFWMSFAQYAFSVGTVLVLVCAAGLFRQLLNKRPAAIMAALYVVPYLYLLGKSPIHVTRYLNETPPFLLPFAGSVFLWIPPLRWRVLYQAPLLLLCMSQLPYTLAINRSLASDVYPRDRASEWICRQIRPRSVIGLEYEANFLTPGHLFMQYWKGRRYPAETVSPPDFKVVVWDESKNRWPDPAMSYWVQNNQLYSGLGRKIPSEIARVRQKAQRMEAGFHPVQTFERTLRWGPFRYALPASAGLDWIIFFPTITLYEKNR